MSDFRVLVADDEPLARGMLATLLRDAPEVAEVLTCADAVEVTGALTAWAPDIVFLDIEMPGTSGMALAAAFPTESPVVVFVTAYSEHAPLAFDIRAADYVLKPFSDQRLLQALDRAKARVRDLDRQRSAEPATLPANAADRPSSHLQRLAVRDNGETVVVKMTDVLWIEAQDYYVLLHTRQGRHLLRATLASLEERLDPKLFVRLHRGALVNLDAVVALGEPASAGVTLLDGSRLPVSRSRRRLVQALLRPRLRR